MKFLIDECLSAELTKAAIDRGYVGSSHVLWIGQAGVQDWNLLPIILGGDWTFVTRNAYDFRGPPEAPGTKGEYGKTDLHAGLVCLNGPAECFDLEQQLELFEVALDELDRDPDLINQVLEVTIEAGGDADIWIRRYGLPEA